MARYEDWDVQHQVKAQEVKNVNGVKKRSEKETIAGLENEWKEENHAKWGGFRREHECRTPTNWGKEMRIQVYGSKNNGNQPDACCGRPGER